MWQDNTKRKAHASKVFSKEKQRQVRTNAKTYHFTRIIIYCQHTTEDTTMITAFPLNKQF